MTKQNFLAMSLGSGMKFKDTYRNSIHLLTGIKTDNNEQNYEGGIYSNGLYMSWINCTPILYPLSDLTKEIEHNGEKFVPIVELAKVAGLSPRKISEISNNKVICDNKGWRSFSEFSFNYNSFHIACFRNGNLAYMDWNIDQIKLFQKLIEWHFDIAGLIEKGEAIDINTIENPYK